VKWYGKYGRKVNWKVKRYEKYGRKGSTPFPNKLCLQKQQISVAYFCSCTGN
jgi:hypothetical protein